MCVCVCVCVVITIFRRIACILLVLTSLFYFIGRSVNEFVLRKKNILPLVLLIIHASFQNFFNSFYLYLDLVTFTYFCYSRALLEYFGAW